MKYLVLINKRFPCDKGESFLENELLHYDRKDLKVIIFPISVCRGSIRTRDVPEHVTVHELNKESLFRMRCSALRIGMKKLFSDDITGTMKECGCKSTLKNRFLYLYQYGVAYLEEERIRKKLEDCGIRDGDEVILYSYWFYTTALTAVNLKSYFLAKNISCRAISRAHGFDVYYKNLHGTEMLRGLDMVYACSENGAAYLRGVYPQYAEKVLASYLGTVDHGVPEYFYDKSEFVILSCSRIVQGKRIRRIAETLTQMEECKTVNRKLKWVHIGDGKDRKKLEEYCRSRFHETEFVFTGYLTNQKVYEYYSDHRVDLFLNVSDSEGLPVSIMEAISFGIPVVATDVGGTTEIVRDGCNGKAISKDFDNQDLAEQIRFFLTMGESEYLKYRENARRIWTENFDAGRNYPAFLESVMSLLCR